MCFVTKFYCPLIIHTRHNEETKKIACCSLHTHIKWMRLHKLTDLPVSNLVSLNFRNLILHSMLISTEEIIFLSAVILRCSRPLRTVLTLATGLTTFVQSSQLFFFEICGVFLSQAVFCSPFWCGLCIAFVFFSVLYCILTISSCFLILYYKWHWFMKLYIFHCNVISRGHAVA